MPSADDQAGASAEAVDPPARRERVVRRRKVFYVSGFDPRGPSWYHGVYKRDSERQAPLLGMEIDVAPRGKAGDFAASWEVVAKTGGTTTRTDYVFLRWDDIIRHYWPRSLLRLWWITFAGYFGYFRSGVLVRILANCWPFFLCISLPFALTLALFVGAAMIGVAAGALLAWLAGLPAWTIAVTSCAIFVPLVVRGTLWLDEAYQIHTVARILAFTILQADRQTPDLDVRLDEFAAILVAAANAGDVDEILLVSHSMGAHLAVSVLARALKRDPELGRRGAVLSYLSVGGTIPLFSWWPQAGWFRDDIQRLASEPSLDWLDFTIAQDGACTAFVDPVETSGLSHPPRVGVKPRLLSAKLFTLFSPEEFAAMKRNWYQVHFQYLVATPKVGDYNYFAITAGPRALADRYAEREEARGFDRFKPRILRRWRDWPHPARQSPGR